MSISTKTSKPRISATFRNRSTESISTSFTPQRWTLTKATRRFRNSRTTRKCRRSSNSSLSSNVHRDLFFQCLIEIPTHFFRPHFPVRLQSLRVEMHTRAIFLAERIRVRPFERHTFFPERFLRRAEFLVGCIFLAVIRGLSREPGNFPDRPLARCFD